MLEKQKGLAILHKNMWIKVDRFLEYFLNHFFIFTLLSKYFKIDFVIL